MTKMAFVKFTILLIVAFICVETLPCMPPIMPFVCDCGPDW